MSESTVPPSNPIWTPEYCLSGLYAGYLDPSTGQGIRVTNSLDAVLAGERDYLIWAGNRPPKKGCVSTGLLFAPCILSGANVRAAFQALECGYATSSDAFHSMAEYGTALTSRVEEYAVSAWCEIDHLSLDEQWSRLKGLESATGMRFGVLLHSGRKSIHSALLYDRCIDPRSETHREIVALLVVALEGDTQCLSTMKKMRVPGFKDSDDVEGGRDQRVLQFDPEIRYAPENVLDRLRRYCRELGIPDTKQAIVDLRRAEKLSRDIERTAPSMSQDERELALSLLNERFRLRGTRSGAEWNDWEDRLASIHPHLVCGRGKRDRATRTGSSRGGFGHHEVVSLSAEGAVYEHFKRLNGRMTSDDIRFDGDGEPYFVSGTNPSGRSVSEYGGRLRVTDWTSGTHYVFRERSGLTEEEWEALIDGFEGAEAVDLPEAPHPVFRFVRDLVYERCLSLEATDDQDNRPTDPREIRAEDLGVGGGEESVPRCLLRETYETTGDTPHRDDPYVPPGTPPERWDQDTLDGVRERFLEHRIFTLCRRGPFQHYGERGNPSGKSHRLPCNAYTCTLCSPRVLVALRAAVYEYLRSAFPASKWTYGRDHSPRDDGAFSKAVKRWRKGAPEHRRYLTISPSPDRKEWFFMWRLEGDHAPTGKRLGVEEVEQDIPDHLAKEADCMVAGVDLDEWREAERRVEIHGGDKTVKKQITFLRDYALGRSRAVKRTKDAAESNATTAIRTYTSVFEMQHLASEHLMMKLEVSDPHVNVRSRSETHHWDVQDGIHLTDAADHTPDAKSILDNLKAKQLFKPMRRRVGNVGSATLGFTDMTLPTVAEGEGDPGDLPRHWWSEALADL